MTASPLAVQPPQCSRHSSCFSFRRGVEGEALKIRCTLKDAHTHAQAHALSLWEKSGKDKMREIKMSDSRVTVKHDREYCLFSAGVQWRHDF